MTQSQAERCQKMCLLLTFYLKSLIRNKNNIQIIVIFVHRDTAPKLSIVRNPTIQKRCTTSTRAEYRTCKSEEEKEEASQT